MSKNSPVMQAAVAAASLLSLGTFTGQLRAQEPAAPPSNTQQPRSVEERLAELERLLRQERLGVQPQEASVRASWVSADTAGVPDLQDAPKAPGVQSTVDLKLWGRANFAASYDNFQGQGGIGGPDFINYIASEGNEELNFNARDTRFGFAAANSWNNWVGRAVFEVDFYGDTTSTNIPPRLRLGYVELVHSDGFSLRAGLDWLPIAQLNPATVDFGILAFGGNTFSQVPQITLRKKSGDSEFLLTAIHTRAGTLQDEEERMPWIGARYAWSGFAEKKGLLAIGAAYRAGNLTNSTGTIRNDVEDYFFALEARMPLISGFTVWGEAWTGKGMGREFLRGGLDYNGDGNEIHGTGGFLNLEVQLCEQLAVNVGAGVDQPHDDDTTTTTLYGTAVPFDSNRTMFANLRYKLSKQAGIGIEFVDFETQRVDPVGDDGTVLRGQRYTFGTWFIF
ncbi:MAG: hypothetical protein JNL12_02480 [Planctomycetes bacterium]|nr:hypothetical protein [Planctomycetota bacterium]